MLQKCRTTDLEVTKYCKGRSGIYPRAGVQVPKFNDSSSIKVKKAGGSVQKERMEKVFFVSMQAYKIYQSWLIANERFKI